MPYSPVSVHWFGEAWPRPDYRAPICEDDRYRIETPAGETSGGTLMAQGPGKYDAECTVARESAGASTAILVILNGRLGDGFAVQSSDPLLELTLPAMLRTIADQIESAA